jgi:hypothetical protein
LQNCPITEVAIENRLAMLGDIISGVRGSVPEIVEDGLTGFVVEDQEEAVAAADRFSQLSRGAIRRRFEGAIHRTADGAGRAAIARAS